MGFSTIRILRAFNVLMFVLSSHKVTISQGNFPQILCEHRSSVFCLFLVLFLLSINKDRKILLGNIFKDSFQDSTSILGFFPKKHGMNTCDFRHRNKQEGPATDGMTARNAKSACLFACLIFSASQQGEYCHPNLAREDAEVLRY